MKLVFNSKSFEKLKTGVLFKHEILKIKDIAYSAADLLSEKTARWSKIWEYTSDLGRIIKEMDMARLMIFNLPSEEYLKLHDMTREDYILYHQGHFLELVHQMKDKLFLLIHALSIVKGKYDEPKRVKLKTIKNSKIKDLPKLLSIWDENSRSGIATALKRRRHYHHLRNSLPLNMDLINSTGLKAILTNESLYNQLNEYGKKSVAQRVEDGFKKWHQDVIQKVNNTHSEITSNINTISAALIKYYGLPYGEKSAKHVIRYFYQKEAKITNQLSDNNIKKDAYLPTLIASKDLLPIILKPHLISMYLVGDVAKGQAIFPISEFEIILVIREQDKDQLKPIILDTFNGIFSQSDFGFNIRVYGDKEFFTEENFKDRFLCKTESVLLAGTDLLGKYNVPTPHIGLAFLLAKDFKKEIQNARQALEILRNRIHIDRLVLKTTRSILKTMHTETIANRAVYTNDLSKIKELAIHAHPENWKTVARIYRFTTGYTRTNTKSLKYLINFAEDKLFPLVDKLEDGATLWLKKWRKEESKYV